MLYVRLGYFCKHFKCCAIFTISGFENVILKKKNSRMHAAIKHAGACKGHMLGPAPRGLVAPMNGPVKALAVVRCAPIITPLTNTALSL
jgi:hypothetical protein